MNQEVCLLHSRAVCYVLSFCFVSRPGEQPLQGSEHVLMCAHRGASMLHAAVKMVTIKVINSEAFTPTFVMFELGQVRDGQCQILAVAGGPVLMHFDLVRTPLMLRSPWGGLLS